MKIYLRGQQGVTTVFALCIMLLLGIFTSGLLPYLSSLSKTSGYNKDQLQAKYAAESGAKRAIANLAKSKTQDATIDWSWLGSGTKSNNSVVSDNSRGSYNVTINNGKNSSYNYVPPKVVPTNNYTIKSIGTFNKATYTIYVTVPVTSQTVDFKTITWNK